MMRATISFHGTSIEITTDHAASSYGQPVVLIDGELTDIAVEYEADEPAIPTVLDRLADAAGVWAGPETRRQLAMLGDQMLADIEHATGADYDHVIAAFQAERQRRVAAELDS
jgi:hypothetical protein